MERSMRSWIIALAPNVTTNFILENREAIFLAKYGFTRAFTEVGAPDCRLLLDSYGNLDGLFIKVPAPTH